MFGKLTYSEIENIASQLSSLAGRMEANLNEIKNELNKVDAGQVWSGDAAREKRAEFDKLSAKFPEFSKAVMDCSKYLNTIVANYKAADRAVQGL